MKQTLMAFMIILSTLNVFSQESSCGCDNRKNSAENQFKCDTILFSNGAKIYWQWNCDSAWLMFENQEKIILSSCEEVNVYECERTGLNFLKEYPNYLLFQYKWISGCCTSPDIVLINKVDGIEMKRITNDLFVWGDIDENYVLSFSDSTYTNLIYLDNDTDKEYTLRFENTQVDKSVAENQVLQLADLFNNFNLKNS